MATWALADYEVEKIQAENLLKKAKATPPFSLLLNDAAYSNRSGGSYRKLREQLQALPGIHLSSSQLGRVMAQLISRRVPEDYITVVPDKGVPFHAEIQEPDDLQYLNSQVGTTTAGHIINIFRRLANQQ